MSWQPNQSGIQQIVSLLTEFQNPNADQHRILAELDKCRAFPDFNNYLSFIFANGEGLAVEVRQSAGLLLKNNLRLLTPMAPSEHHAYVKAALLSALQLPERPLRHTAGTCVVTIIHTEGSLTSWPELLPTLNAALQLQSQSPVASTPQQQPSPSLSRIEGALDTCYKLWEETPRILEEPSSSLTNTADTPLPSDSLVPAIMAHFSSPEPSIRALALSTINLAVGYLSRAILANKTIYIQGLFTLASDPSPDVRKAVCRGLVQIVSIDPSWIDGNLPSVIEYMLVSSQDDNEDVAVEASEFWSAYPESGLDVSALREYLPRLLPVLLKNMVYDEYDEEVLEAEADEEAALSGRMHMRERDSDIKPSHISSHSSHHHSTNTSTSTNSMGAAAGNYSPGNNNHGSAGDTTTTHDINKNTEYNNNNNNNGDAPDNNNNNDDDDDDDDDEVSRWNLRRCSAAGLDMLSGTFGDELLPLLLPEVQAKLGHADWRAREGGILALGAVSEGCAGGLTVHLPSIVGALLPSITDPRPMVRSITCWALTRYSRSMLDRAEGGDPSMLDAVVNALCDRLADHNRKVQGAACGSVATLCEEAGKSALPFLGRIFIGLGDALVKYGKKTSRNAYDAIASIAEHVPGAFQVPEGSALVLPRLFAKLSGLPDGDREILPLLECIGCVSQAAGPAQLRPYVESGFRRCVDMADGMNAAAANGAIEKDEADEFIVAAFDALGGMIEGLGAGVESLVSRSALCDVVASCTGDESPEVRQSAFALAGDLARCCMPHLKRNLGGILSSALHNIEPGSINQANLPACNNAAWALGEIAVACPPEEVAQFAMPALERLVRIVAAPTGGLPRSLVENAAIGLGRIAWVTPEVIAPHGNVFMAPWCSALRMLRDGLEKEQAFWGVCGVLGSNPSAGASAFTSLCEAIVSWKVLPKNGLEEKIVLLMQGYKEQLVGLGQWDIALKSLSEPAARKLVEMCRL